ncbi:hypothetical protein [Streptomyces sp. NBC_01794]|uniref:hypothetical protein n=1 Tax=Streptomyces sp. NBC_01794 TaxID=2975942 RepID=UPI003085682D|nr:hypothetical protein OIE54_12030 [Streptomyces sp. NBC_01794]
MGRVQVSRKVRARLGVLLGGAMAAAGVGLAAGLSFGLMAAGIGLVAYCLLLADVDPAEGGGRVGRS